MRDLYPEIVATKHFFLTADNYQVYVEEAGNPNGVPVIFLHGGPGSGCNENHRRYFNPEKYRIVLFDQRGCHRSKPVGGIQNNHTAGIIADIETIRQQLKVKQWLLFGGSWGVTLALAYAQKYPDYVSAMVLRGSFLARQQDLDWFLEPNGVAQIFPEYWQTLTTAFNGNHGKKLVTEFYQTMTGTDTNAQAQAAKAWNQWAGQVVLAALDTDYVVAEDEIETIVNETRIEAHYAINGYFLTDNQLLNNINQLPKVPIKIIHGRRDLTCLPASAWTLYQTLLTQDYQVELELLPKTGHLASELAMVDALIRATDSLLTSQCQ